MVEMVNGSRTCDFRSLRTHRFRAVLLYGYIGRILHCLAREGSKLVIAFARVTLGLFGI
jgi:hypothetical protein